MTLFLRYIEGPQKGTIKERKIILGAGRVMSIGHDQKNTFALPKSANTRDVNATIRRQGSNENPTFVVSAKEGQTDFSVRGSPFKKLDKKGTALSHGMRVRIGEHTFEAIDDQVQKQTLAVEYHNGPLKGKFKRRPLALDFHKVMTVGSKKGAAVALPKDSEVHEKHAVITKDVQNGTEIFRLHPREGPVWVQPPGGHFKILNDRQVAELSAGTQFIIGPHILKIVPADGKIKIDKPVSDKTLPNEFQPVRNFYLDVRRQLTELERKNAIRPGQANAIDLKMRKLLDLDRPEHPMVLHFMNSLMSSFQNHSPDPQHRADYLQHNLDAILMHYGHGRVGQKVERLGHRLDDHLLNPVERQLLHQVGQRILGIEPDHASDAYRFVAAYFSDPYRVNTMQNQIISKKPMNQRADWLKAAVTLNAKTESRHYPCIQPHTPNTAGYHTLGAMGYLFEGDILPGRNFQLGRPFTYDREILEIQKTGAALPFLLEARKMATGKNTELEIADALNQKIYRETEYHLTPLSASRRAGPATILADKQGVCRHKAALLAMMLQEAGIHCRYIRGNYGHRGGHAWIQAQMDGKQYVLDPTSGKFFALTGKNRDEQAANRYINRTPWNQVWRPYLRLN